MAILEIGAGTGGATNKVLPVLSSGKSSRRYASYTFTDITTSFLHAAQSTFSEFAAMDYRTLDIERDPFEQGYTQSYDPIIASQALHATRDLSNTLRNVRKFLRPVGKLLLLELTQPPLAAGLALGTFPDYWNSIEEWRCDSPFADTAMWHKLFKDNGFSGIDAALDDYERDLAMATTLLTSAVDSSSSLSHVADGDQVFLVYNSYPHPLARALEKELRRRRRGAHYTSPADTRTIPEGSLIISLVDIEYSMLSKSQEDDFEAMRDLLKRCQSMLWLSLGDPVRGRNPQSAIFAGTMRTLVLEMPQIICTQLHSGERFT